jgi:hypothetical protein
MSLTKRIQESLGEPADDIAKGLFVKAKQLGLATDFEWDPHHTDNPTVTFFTNNPAELVKLAGEFMPGWKNDLGTEGDSVTFQQH